ncbi:MAG: KH domain-containing protein [Syntrophobacteria bacterium]|jgi:hypothetical protein
MKELVEFMAKAMVDNPDQVEVTEIAGRDTSVIEMKVAKEDMGQIIGKKGRNAQAMRLILNAASAQLRKHVVFEIIDQ